MKKEISIAYPDNQRKLYFKNSPDCIYPFWHKSVGIHKTGKNFPVMVAKKFFNDLGYETLDDYLLVRCPRKRPKNLGFKKLCKIFGEEKIQRLIKESRYILNIQPGGDPDLFVYNKKTKETFFVEVKENDKVTENQKKLFPIIEKYLATVYVARVISFNKNNRKVK